MNGPALPRGQTGDLSGAIADVVRLLRSDRDWTARMPEILALLGNRLNVCRVYLFQIHELADGRLGQTCRHDWSAPGLASLAADPRNVDEAFGVDPLFEEWTARRRRGETIHGHTRDLTGYLRDDFEHQRIKSFLSIPIMVNGLWWGHIGFDDCEVERDWTEAERSVLESVAYLIGNAIELSGSSLVMSEASRQAMLNTALDGIVVIDEESRVLEFNPAAEAMFGHDRASVLGRRLSDCIIPHEEREHHEAGFRRYLAGGPSRMMGRRVEANGLKADGSLIPVELTITEIHVAHRRLFVAYLRDLTERRAAEAEVARQRNARYQSEKMSALGSLLAGIAHELNNPLSVVVGRAIMLEEDCRDARQMDQIRRLREAAERCARIAQTFLKMARQSPTARRATRLDQVVHTALEMVGYAARSSGVEVVLDLQPNLPATQADSDQIVQVLVNLMINAVQAMGTVDGPRVLTVRTGMDAFLSHLSIEVEDTGPGVPAALTARIFEPFFTTKDVGMGTGVGLAVSQGMIASHNGSLSVENVPGGGARFRVSLPIEAPLAPALDTAVPPPAKAPGGLSVLVVDDEPEVADLIREILTRAGHSVDVAENGKAGLRRTEDRRYDAVFCDLRMPELDGRGFRSALARRDPELADRIVFVTGDHFGQGVDAGFVDGCPVIEKPFRATDVLAALPNGDARQPARSL
ncbi:hybrid sensor histidine kinase/response regulator [Chthonobacter albigriseus]|uniref:hybrid sensor histidine kinase/response regulator n=1 Tax=Chthonobacter albigriseus TaxID=1683161 RepID=UPI0015EEBA4B|nr:PAS domain S-box protein [Chthonobacter albigriseus]